MEEVVTVEPDAARGYPPRSDATYDGRVSRNVLIAFVVVALAGGVAARIAAGDGPHADRSSTSTPEPLALREVVLDAVGLAVGYPTTWERVETEDPQIALLATPNGADSALVRIVPVAVTVRSVEELPAVRAVTDAIVTGDPQVQVLLGPEPVVLADAPGYYYLYRFRDAATGQTGVHAHYFLFVDGHMVVLVMQALPEERFSALAPVFDAIAASLRRR